MRDIVAARTHQLTPSGIRKVNEKALAMERAGRPVLHFEIGRPDFDTPAYIKAAAVEALEGGDVFYTSNFGAPGLRQAIADKLRRENSIPCTPDQVLVTVGLSEAVFDVLCAILDPGDELLVPDPVWMNYRNVPSLLGATPVSYHLLEQRAYQPDLAELEELITPRTKALVLVSPNNPTGGVLSEEVLSGLADLAIRHDLWVLSDEIYERILFDGCRHISIASLPGMGERTFTLNGFSKAYSMTGWRVGYVAAPAEQIAVLNKIHQHNTTCAPSFVQTAAAAALTEEGNEVADMVAEYQRRRDCAVAAINAVEGLHCLAPKGAFYLFINAQQLGMPCGQLAEYLLDQAAIALVPGDVFGPGGDGYLRMSFANSYENIVEGCRRLEQAIRALPGQ